MKMSGIVLLREAMAILSLLGLNVREVSSRRISFTTDNALIRTTLHSSHGQICAGGERVRYRVVTVIPIDADCEDPTFGYNFNMRKAGLYILNGLAAFSLSSADSWFALGSPLLSRCTTHRGSCRVAKRQGVLAFVAICPINCDARDSRSQCGRDLGNRPARYPFDISHS